MRHLPSPPPTSKTTQQMRDKARLAGGKAGASGLYALPALRTASEIARKPGGARRRS